MQVRRVPARLSPANWPRSVICRYQRPGSRFWELKPGRAPVVLDALYRIYAGMLRAGCSAGEELSGGVMPSGWLRVTSATALRMFR
jgi:hypothetical protein